MTSWKEMATETKEIVDGAMNRQKPLGLARRFELSHLAFAVAWGLMRDFGSVVSSMVLAVADAGDEFSTCHPITPQAIGHQQPGNIA